MMTLPQVADIARTKLNDLVQQSNEKALDVGCLTFETNNFRREQEIAFISQISKLNSAKDCQVSHRNWEECEIFFQAHAL